MAKLVVFGRGTIGAHIIERAPAYDHDVELVVTSKGIFERNGAIRIASFSPGTTAYEIVEQVIELCKARGINYAMLAIPSSGDGMVESTYLMGLVDAGIKCVTAGKSAIANRFDDIRNRMRHIGFDAALGGGTGILTFLSYALKVHQRHPFILTLVCNGTLNFALTKVLEGWTSESICLAALRSGYAEPPADGKKLDALSLFVGEFDDVRRKIAIALNTRMHKLIGQTVNQGDLNISSFAESDLRTVMSGNARYRYLVRIGSREEDLEFFSRVISGGRILQCINGLYVAAGFVNVVAGSALDKWLPLGAGNAAHLIQNGDLNLVVGEGAGAVSTVGAMMSNLETFIEAENI